MIIPNRNSKRIRSDSDRAAYLSGLPYRFWRVDWTKIVPQQFSHPEDSLFTVTKATQQEWLHNIVENPSWALKPNLLLLASYSTDDLARAVLAVLSIKARMSGVDVFCHDAGDKTYTHEHDPLAPAHAIGVYNLSMDSPTDHVQRVRNLLYRNEDKARIVAVTAENPFEAASLLGMTPNAMFLFKGVLRNDLLNYKDL